jgi:SNF2 family DNA or RNA helicase
MKITHVSDPMRYWMSCLGALAHGFSVAHAIVHSEAKSLVFSQYSSTLSWLQEELPKHGFQFRTLSGDMTMKNRAKALRDFQSDPPTTIFLLSMRAGAVGINLTEANRVFLMEPCFNPALERQAIGRGKSIRFDKQPMCCEVFLS